MAAQDHVRAAKMIEQVAYLMARRMELHTLGRWMASLPADVFHHTPGLVAPYLMVLSMTNRYHDYERFLETAEHAAQTMQNQEVAHTIVLIPIHFYH